MNPVINRIYKHIEELETKLRDVKQDLQDVQNRTSIRLNNIEAILTWQDGSPVDRMRASSRIDEFKEMK